MPSLIVRNIPTVLKEALRVRAAESGHSMEEEVRVILHDSLRSTSSGRQTETAGTGLGTRIHRIAMGTGGFELKIPPRDQMREPPEL